MRLWSVHPCYLDPSGLTACWREGLLARKVLAGATSGYRNHPQLLRFRQASSPLAAIDSYLHGVCDEADRRGYRFDRSKLGIPDPSLHIPVTDGQLLYEMEHLRKKLQKRRPAAYAAILHVEAIEPHPLFTVTAGGIENWEVIRKK